ncbi:FCD domain-containing protein [Knoellia sp. S7-12]|uniref:FadR/GntR family transcriptional regulator n=1 Tax=Knoellia sp. S7-12 TaxID=3126698 RepID=UPI003369AC75
MTQSPPAPTPAIRPSSLHGQVLARIGADLVDGKLTQGTVVTMDSLESQYGASRSAIREVVRVLESIGVAVSRRRVGVRFLPQSQWEALSPVVVAWRLDGGQRADQLRELSELRRGIEPVAASLAAQRATPEQVDAMTAAVVGMSVTGPRGDLERYLEHDVAFHTTLLEASGNAALASFAPLVHEALRGRTAHHLMPTVPEPDAIRWHVEVAQAVAAGEAVRAEATMRQIVHEAQESMSAVLDEEPATQG